MNHFSKSKYHQRHDPKEPYQIFLIKHGKPNTAFFQLRNNFRFWVTDMTKVIEDNGEYFCFGDALNYFCDQECERRYRKYQGRYEDDHQENKYQTHINTNPPSEDKGGETPPLPPRAKEKITMTGDPKNTGVRSDIRTLLMAERQKIRAQEAAEAAKACEAIPF